MLVLEIRWQQEEAVIVRHKGEEIRIIIEAGPHGQVHAIFDGPMSFSVRRETQRPTNGEGG